MKIEDIPIPQPKNDVDEKNFDLEKWRKDVPINYYETARLLTAFDQPILNSMVFNTIYQIIQLHIPDTLYKYIPLKDNPTSNEKRFNALLKNRLFLSKIDSFNDPFDCKAYYYNPRTLMKYVQLKPYNGKLVDDFSAMVRAVSLSANGVQSLPMWAHYANNHAGFCVSYDMTDRENSSLKSCTFPVFYTNDRLDITSLMDSFVRKTLMEIKAQSEEGKKEILIDDFTMAFLSSLLCNVKHSSWSYESEYRCTKGATAPGIPFVEAKAKEIYIGFHCEEDNARRIYEIGKTLNIPVFQMGFDEISDDYQLSVTQILG